MMSEQPQRANGNGDQVLSPFRDRFWVFNLGTFWGLPVGAHFSYALFFQIEVYAAFLAHFNVTFSLFIFLLYGPLLFLTLFLHEVGHTIATNSLGGRAESIVVWPLGGFSFSGVPAEGSLSDDLLVAIAGPMTHMLQGGLWVGVYSVMHLGDFSEFTDLVDMQRLGSSVVYFISSLVSQLVLINAALLACNLVIPAYPLGGGRILSTLLVIMNFKVRTASRITGVLSALAGAALLGYGIFFYIETRLSYGVSLGAIGVFAIHSGITLLRMTSSGLINEHPLFYRQCYRMVDVNQGSYSHSPVNTEVELT